MSDPAAGAGPADSPAADRAIRVAAAAADLPAADRAVRIAAGAFAGFALTAAANALAIAATVPGAPSLGIRVLHHAFDATETLALGALSALALGLWTWKAPARLWLSLVVYTAVASLLMNAILGQDLQRQSLVALEGTLAVPLQVLFTILCGMAIPAAHLLGASLGRFRRLRAIPMVAALGGIVTNHAIVRDDYPPLHGAVAWAAATLAGAVLAPAAADLARRAWSTPRGRLLLLAALALSVLGVAVPPPNAVRLQLYREPGASGAWLLSQTLWSTPSIPAAPPPSPWFEDRSAAPPVLPTVPPLFPEPPVVVLITIDATRAEAVLEPTHEAMYPTLSRIMRVGATFTDATTPGSQTSVSLTTLFSGRYFSELRWSMHGVGSSRFDYAADDQATRFPALLAERGVHAESFCTINFLAGDFGVLRGFETEHVVAKGREHAPAKAALDLLIERLRLAKDEPLFLYAHLTEPHSPYDRGTVKTGSEYERYLSEIAAADAQIGRVERVLVQRFPRRGLLLLASDHGEAFGEHETFFHTKTLYEELLRVPLVARGAGVAHRRIEQHVGLIDLGPTILDLFGVPVPATFGGQSLVPLLAGRDPTLTRPLLAEGRLRKALYIGDLKAIEDDRRKVVEVYDLAADPGETQNLFDSDRARAEPAIAALRAFFASHTYRAPGYSAPFKP